MAATVNIVVTRVQGAYRNGEALPIIDAFPATAAVATATTSGSVTASPVITVASGQRPWSQVWVVTVTGANVWAKFGDASSAPTASAGNDWLILDGETREFTATRSGTRLAVLGT